MVRSSDAVSLLQGSLNVLTGNKRKHQRCEHEGLCTIPKGLYQQVCGGCFYNQSNYYLRNAHVHSLLKTCDSIFRSAATHLHVEQEVSLQVKGRLTMIN